jgi:methionine-rich copper-binding protein CopC
MRKALVAAVLGSLLLLVSPAPAFAHADLIRSTPSNGSVVSQAPSTIRLTFSETVTLDSAVILDASGASLPARGVIDGAVLTLTPASPLRPGATTVTFEVTSDDGHQFNGAIAFVIGKPGPRGPAQSIQTTPMVITQLLGSRPGYLTVSFGRKATSGEVVWTSPNLKGSLTWHVHARGMKSEATGVLPFPGAWSMKATLVSAKGALVITSGTATLHP